MASCAAIRVSCSNGGVKVWANSFNEALNFVKSVQGRKFNPANKSWNVPVSIAKLNEMAGRNGCDVREDEDEDEDMQELHRNFNPFKEGSEGHKECSQAVDANLSSLLKKLGVDAGV